MTETTAPAAGTREGGAAVPRLPPPLYFGAAFAAGLLLHAKAPLPIGARPATAVLGGALLGAGAAMCAAAVSAVLRHRTTIVPHHAVTVLLTTGVYRVSRNPMYSGLAIAYVGGSLLRDAWWPLVTLPAALLIIRNIVIGPEERYLAEHFGRSYTDYQGRARRWL